MASGGIVDGWSAILPLRFRALIGDDESRGKFRIAGNPPTAQKIFGIDYLSANARCLYAP